MNEPLIFDIALGRTKPVNMRDASVRCPFCDRSKLTDILAQDGHIRTRGLRSSLKQKATKANYLLFPLMMQHGSFNSV